ncbi:MFS transporter [Amycolatopsis sp. NPDC057786]|uniref:MFS transporter n=1 Tax=Amycolatopsis sp. NPDC057786 TaxID=3346250 RepID=UPI00366F561E
MTRPADARTPKDAAVPPRGGLTSYVIAATLARVSDGGAVVAVVLLVSTSGDAPALAGLLGACITAPHLVGPFLARVLDTARDGRAVIAAASLIHALTLAGALLAYGHLPHVITAALLISSGLVGPFLTGGISSRLPSIAGPEVRQQRRAQGWDVATYGIAGTIGPSLVAALSASASPRVAGLILAAGALIASGVVWLLPHQPPAGAGGEAPRPVRTLALMVRSGPLRRTLLLTITVALSVAVLPITAVASTGRYDIHPSSTGLLVAAYGLGNLAGAVAVMFRPPTGDADQLTLRLAAAVAIGLTAVLASPVFGVALAAYAITGIANAYFFASTLAARSEYAPPRARGQVFVWVGALKITAGSAGTALAGAAITVGVHALLALAAVLTAGASASALADRRRRPGN